jgi:hypothetical protein
MEGFIMGKPGCLVKRELRITLYEDELRAFRRFCRDQGLTPWRAIRNLMMRYLEAGGALPEKGGMVELPKRPSMTLAEVRQAEVKQCRGSDLKESFDGDEALWRYKQPFGGVGVETKEVLSRWLREGRIVRSDVIGRVDD